MINALQVSHSVAHQIQLLSFIEDHAEIILNSRYFSSDYSLRRHMLEQNLINKMCANTSLDVIRCKVMQTLTVLFSL